MSKIIGVGPHYSSALKERGLNRIDPLLLFIKPTTTIVSNHEKIQLPNNVEKVVAEVEIAIKVNQKIKNKSVEEIEQMNVIGGYAIACDVTAQGGNVFGYGKYYDSFTPLGSFIKLPTSTTKIELKSFLNGELMQVGNTSEMGYSFEKIISYCSYHFTIEENDILLTGTPAGTFEIHKGDIVRFQSPQLGEITHSVG